MESKNDNDTKVVVEEYLSDSDDDFDYEAIPESDSDEDLFSALQQDETLASIEKSVSRTKTNESKEANDEEKCEDKLKSNKSSKPVERKKEAETVLRPAVIDDFFRKFLIKLQMNKTLETFNNEWYELKARGKLSEEQVGVVPDIYIRNEELDDTVKLLRAELEQIRSVSEKAQSTWTKFKTERDFHRMHHKRVVQEKNKIITELKRLKKHYETYEPTIQQLRAKYELAMKEKMMMKIERDKATARSESLENQLKSIQVDGHDGLLQDATPAVAAAPASASRTARSTAMAPAAKKSGGKGSDKSQKKPRQGFLPDTDPENPFETQHLPKATVSGLSLSKTFEGHINAIAAVAYHPKKQVVATASDDHTWKLWSIPHGDLILSGEGHTDWVGGIDFHPAGSHLATASGDGTVKIWDFAKTSCIGTITGHGQPVWDCSWHYTGDFVVSGSMDQTAKLWDAATLKCKQTFRGHVDSVNAVVFQPYTSNVCTASGDKTVSIWDARSGLCVQTYFGHNNACSGLTVNMQGDKLYSCDADGVVKVWDIRMVTEIASFATESYAINDVCVDASGSIVAAASDNGTVTMFDLDSGEIANVLQGHEDAVQSVIFEPSNKYFISVSSDRTFRVWK